jgi:hypothetical protein
MPTLKQLDQAAERLAEFAGKDCCPQYLFWLAENASRRPQDWGFPRSYAYRPNWAKYDIRREVSRVLWRLPTHPSRVAREFRYLPFRILAEIADGFINLTWPHAPSSKIRHEWLAACSANRQFGGKEWRDWLNNPLRWVCRHCPIGSYYPRSLLIAQWLEEKKGWKGWTKGMSVGYGPDGTPVTIRPVELLDEVFDDDLTAGIKTNPERVFRAVLKRKSEAELARIAYENAPFPEMPWTEIPGVEQIRYARDLVAEGNRMGHCVGGYADYCRRGGCFILRLPHSTAEILPDGKVYQHRSYQNSEPTQKDQELLARWLANRKTKQPKTN